MKRAVSLSLVVVGVAQLASLLWRVPYLYTAIGFATWALVGHLITADDELPGEWSNPDGAAPSPWAELGLKALALLALALLAYLSPSLRALRA